MANAPDIPVVTAASSEEEKEFLQYTQAWAALRRRQWTCWALFLGYIPGVPLVGFPIAWLIGSVTPIYFVAIGWMMAICWAGWRSNDMLCPRCGNHWILWRRGCWPPLVRRCPYCALPKGFVPPDPRVNRS